MTESRLAELKILERPLIVAIAYISGVIVAGIIIGLWRFGIDLGAVFLGMPWSSPLEQTRGTIAIEGALVFVTLLFGSLFIFSIMTLIRESRLRKQQPAQPETEGKSE